jgi:hypothetical protein
VDNTVVKNTDHFAEIMKNKSGGVMLEGVYTTIPGVFYYAFGM